MFVVVFRAEIRKSDSDYAEMSARMRDLAMNHFGCLEFHSVTEGQNEIALSYWPDEKIILAWKENSEHLIAQRLGRDRWYSSFSIQVARITREYRIEV